MILMIDDNNSNNNEKNIAHDTSNNSYNYDIQMCPMTVHFRYFHLQDNADTSVDHSDKLWKVRGFLDSLAKTFQEVYEVDGHATVDKSMVKFKGRLGFRQYLPLKPIK